ncbi:uncharacterized protein LOC135653225 isoform X4 [Musa acuminata AAA Group]|uniref:uncharacterized protein LOC103972578 isoform X2 n=1 Tax=Musa acuminata AAA Group TaxID=214697 RepID=UPI0031DDCB97
MALMMMTAFGPKLPLQRDKSRISRVMVPLSLKATLSRTTERATACNVWEGQSLTFLHQRGLRHSPWSTFAVGPGLEASISDPSKNDIRLDNVKIVIESRDNDKITVRVDLTGEETQKAFDIVLTNLARTAPPIPGFRRMKGGKTSNVPKSFLLQMLGRDRVTKFLIQEIVGITIGDYVKKENLKVKSQFKTIQTAEELEAAFTPGSEFGFNAVVDVENSDSETTSSSAS